MLSWQYDQLLVTKVVEFSTNKNCGNIVVIIIKTLFCCNISLLLQQTQNLLQHQKIVMIFAI